MPPVFEFEHLCDDLGPAKIVHICDPECGLRAVVVVDNVACGPSIGGIRMAPDVTTGEVFRLARAMSCKNVAAGLAHGGGKAGIMADPKSPEKPRLIRAFARAIRHLVEYIPGPDMGTNESCMAWIFDEIGRAVGLPRVLGGIPLDEIGATGYGLAQCAVVASTYCDLKLTGASVAVEGFGNVGRHAARFLEEMGAKLVAASDSRGAIYDPQGISTADLARIKSDSGSVTHWPKGQRLSQADLLTVPCDILVPAARPDCIREDNAHRIQARLILQGANIPATPAAESILHRRGVLSVPDFIANAGGVICAAVEYHGGTQASAFSQIAEKIRGNAQEVLSRSREEQVEPRRAALELAHERLKTAMALRTAG
ncbi:MAG: Glu/Leu/Phe/Val dehydrogenase [Planctomycetia bacterium]|nr:Glu/Leu/Phe/Val dehydrogenase [Planctomycetia bacterium]